MSSRPLDPEVLRTALQSAPGHIIVTDEEYRIRYLNRVEHGFDLEQLIGTSYLAVLPPAQARKVQAVLERARETGEPQQYETFLEAPAGGRQWYSTQISWFEASDGSKGMICILTESTKQREAEQRVEALRHDLVQASHRAGMAEIATGVLHNVGNVLNSVNVSADTLMRELESSRLHLLGKAVKMLADNRERLAEFLRDDPKGGKLVELLAQVDAALEGEHERLRKETSRLAEHLTMMRSIVEAQQTIARLGDMSEPARPEPLIEQILSMFQLDLETRFIEVALQLEEVGKVVLDKQATLQVLANLVRNAIESLEEIEGGRHLWVRLRADDDRIHFEVEDNGMGIAPENLPRLFEHGFSTKRNGHGFGLHASAVAARTMNGTREAVSEGPGQGACFRLSLPRVLP